jgi:hypothetical protein
MIDEDSVPAIEQDELLSRCVLSSKYVRAATSGDLTTGRVKAGPLSHVPMTTFPLADIRIRRSKKYGSCVSKLRA